MTIKQAILKCIALVLLVGTIEGSTSKLSVALYFTGNYYNDLPTKDVNAIVDEINASKIPFAAHLPHNHSRLLVLRDTSSIVGWVHIQAHYNDAASICIHGFKVIKDTNKEEYIEELLTYCIKNYKKFSPSHISSSGKEHYLEWWPTADNCNVMSELSTAIKKMGFHNKEDYYTYNLTWKILTCWRTYSILLLKATLGRLFHIGPI